MALVGVLGERYATADCQVLPPRQAVLEALGGAKGKFDAAIVLAYLPEDELRQLAEALPEADVVAGGPTAPAAGPEASRAPRCCARPRTRASLSPGSMPRRPARPIAGRGASSSSTGNSPTMRGRTANIGDFRAELARGDFTPQQTAFAEPLPAELPKGYAVAGTAACRKCHEADYRVWRKSSTCRRLEIAAGARGPTSIRSANAAIRPATGCPAGSPRRVAAPARHEVGCESCHGPSQGHAAEPAVRTAHYTQAKNYCTGCHDRENSPQFAFDKYWHKIAHGEAAGSKSRWLRRCPSEQG